jgi:hypothetical protein
VLKVDSEKSSPENNIKNLKGELRAAASIKVKGFCYIKSIQTHGQDVKKH